MSDIEFPQYECKKCGYKWPPRKVEVKRCPRCTSFNWNKNQEEDEEDEYDLDK